MRDRYMAAKCLYSEAQWESHNKSLNHWAMLGSLTIAVGPLEFYNCFQFPIASLTALHSEALRHHCAETEVKSRYKKFSD